MTEYRITFGVQYRIEPHPAGSWPHPDGWLSVFTDDPALVRPLTAAIVGRKDQNSPLAFSFDYHPDEPGYPTLDRYPRGQLASIRFTVND